MIDAFGWSWEYIDEEMTLPRFEAICKHWERVPPLAVSAAAIAAALGVKRAQASSTSASAAGNEDEKAASRQGLFDLLAGGGSGINKEMPEWLRAAMT